MRQGGGGRIVGRDAQVEQARAALGRVAAATGHALLITGEAGIGKTRLTQAVLDAASDRFTVAAEAASELETDLPFAPLVRALRLRPDAADPEAAALGALLADPGSDADLLRLRMIEGIADLLERWSLERPVLLVVEDLHWADEPTLQVLDRLARRLQYVGVLLVGTARPHPRPAGLQALQRTLAQVDSTVIELGPLGAEPGLELARATLGAEPGPQLATALAQAGGNPLYLTELLAAAARQIDPDGDVADLPTPGVPESVRLAILRNLAALPQATVELLRVAAVLGTRFALRQLALALDRGEPDLIDDLAPALASGVVTEAGDRLAFRHDLVRDAVYEDQPEAVREAWHRRVVERLRDAGAPVEDLVPHLQRGSLEGVPESVGWLAEAGRAMRSRSVPVAIELADGADPELRLDLVEALAGAGRADEAESAGRPLLAAPPETFDEHLRDRLVLLAGPLAPTARPADCEPWLAALEAAGLSERGRGRAIGVRAWLRWAEGRLEEAVSLATQALDAATRTGDQGLASLLAEYIRARAGEASWDYGRSLQSMRNVLAHARRVPDQPELLVLAAAPLAWVLGQDPSGRAEARTLVAEGLAVAGRLGLERWQAHLEGVAAVNAHRAGDWQEAAVAYESVLGDGWDDGSPLSVARAQTIARAAMLNVHRDEVELAGARLAQAQEMAAAVTITGVEVSDLAVIHVAASELRAAHGDAEAAMAAAHELAAFVDRLEIGVYHVIYLPNVTAVALSVGRDDEALAAVERAEAWLAGADPTDPNVDGLGRWGRAVVTADAETLDALVAWADEPRPLWEWRPRIREDAAAALARAGERDQAVQRLEEALALWDHAEARRDVGRVRRALRALGVRRGRGLAADRPDTGWESLTDAEWRVVALVREGLTYREIAERLFLSRRTVETHVAHVFRKLEVSSRRDLAALLDGDEGRRHLAERAEAVRQP